MSYPLDFEFDVSFDTASNCWAGCVRVRYHDSKINTIEWVQGSFSTIRDIVIDNLWAKITQTKHILDLLTFAEWYALKKQAIAEAAKGGGVPCWFSVRAQWLNSTMSAHGQTGMLGSGSDPLYKIQYPNSGTRVQDRDQALTTAPDSDILDLIPF